MFNRCACQGCDLCTCKQQENPVGFEWESGEMPEMYLELSTALACWGGHGGHGGSLIRHCSLQLRGRPGQRGQGNGLGQRLEHRAGLGQSACRGILH